MFSIDEMFYLMGDEDGGVGLNCRICNLGGLPVVYYTTDPNDITYREHREVVRVSRISDLMTAGLDHVATHQKETANETRRHGP